MNVSTRIFSADDSYELAVRTLTSLGVPNREINVLMPDTTVEGIKTAHVEDVAVFVRGVGRVIASGDRAKALIKAAGRRREHGDPPGEGAVQGLPLDDFFVLEDALRRREKAVFVSVPERHQWEKIEAALDECGGKDVHRAREEWWSGIGGKEEQAIATGEPHDVDDYLFRVGFEAALHPSRRKLTFEEARGGLSSAHPEAVDVESFRQGYSRGRAHQEALDNTTRGAADRG